MGHIPAGTQWYIAELVEEITVSSDPRNVVHRNLVLIRADSPDEAYDKAIKLGYRGETSYDNPIGQLVQIKFRGLADLDVVYDEPEDGAELLFHREIGVAPDELAKLLRPRDKLRVFQPPKQHEGPDYSSKEVLDEVERQFGTKRPEPQQ